MERSEIELGVAFGFTVVGLIVVFGPLIAEKLRLPGLLGLLLGGALIGPNMLDVLPSFESLESVGEIGVLYLIFLAGMQLDIEAFVRYRRISLGFGLLTAFIPLVLGTLVALAFDFDWSAALLIGSFWASFTLITYPTISRYGLTRNPAVAATVGASSITDTISLIILALVIGAETGDSSRPRLVIGISLGLVVLAVWCFVVVPAIARWFFSGLGEERTLRFVFVLISLTSAAVVAELVEIEPLIGAFFVGVGLNRVVPNRSPLMSVTDFFGNAFFIPTFLVSVGLLFDPEVMFVWETIRLAIGFGAALVVGKVIAAWLSGRIFGLSPPEVGLMASVSVAQAAATLAATIIGLEAGLYGDDVVNAVMVVVGVSLILTSVGTGRFAPQVHPPEGERRRVGEAVLLPVVGAEETIRPVVALAARLTAPVGGVVQPIVVVTSADDAALEQGRQRQRLGDQVLRHAGRDTDCLLRLDRSVAQGLSRAAIEDDCSLLLLAWPGPNDARAWLLGANYEEIASATSLPIAIAAIHGDGNVGGRTILFARERDLLPANRRSLQVGVDLATTVAERTDVLAVGPVPPAEIAQSGVVLPDDVEHLPGPEDVEDFAAQHAATGDLIVVPVRQPEIRAGAIRVFDSGVSVLAVAHNPESQSSLGATTMTLPTNRAS